MTKQPQYLTVTEAAKALNVTRQTVYTMLDKGRLTRHQVAGYQFVTVDAAFKAEQSSFRKRT